VRSGRVRERDERWRRGVTSAHVRQVGRRGGADVDGGPDVGVGPQGDATSGQSDAVGDAQRAGPALFAVLDASDPEQQTGLTLPVDEGGRRVVAGPVAEPLPAIHRHPAVRVAADGRGDESGDAVGPDRDDQDMAIADPDQVRALTGHRRPLRVRRRRRAVGDGTVVPPLREVR
jgi:hypothetical protein